MPKLILCAFIALLLALPASSQAKKEEDSYCGMLPKSVVESGAYSGWSACRLRDMGEKPLWQGLPKKTNQVIRFTFTQGHGMFMRVVTITQAEDGTALLRVSGTQKRSDYREPEEPMRARRVRLSIEDMARIERLATESGVWDFEVGTWDHTVEGDTSIYLHCQLLEMERISANGYRFSSVNIGCNQPKKLMPLVNEVIRLGGMKNTGNGMLFE